jgi:ABC-2 type transport system permease protein
MPDNFTTKPIKASVTWVAFSTIVRKEVVRFMRIWGQTILPPAITQSLYFLIFGTIIGSQISSINGLSYMQFVVPGIIMMSIITNSYSNVLSSFFGAKLQKYIEEVLVSPTPNWVVMAGYVGGGVLRGMVVGLVVFAVSFFFTLPKVENPMLVIFFSLLTAIVFSLAGFMNAIFAEKFDDLSIIPTFILTPLTYLGGVFYSIKSLPAFWSDIAKFNPIVYMVDGFRAGFYGVSDFQIWYSTALLIIVATILSFANLYLMKKGIGVKN